MRRNKIAVNARDFNAAELFLFGTESAAEFRDSNSAFSDSDSATSRLVLATSKLFTGGRMPASHKAVGKWGTTKEL
jgi:hypothetical protein